MWKISYRILLFTPLLLTANASLNNIEKVKETCSQLENILEYSTILFPLTSVSNTNIVSKECQMQMQQLRRGILERKAWALKVLDASGTKPPAFMFGANYWLGSHELCAAVRNGLHLDISLYVEHKMNISLLSATSPFNVDYRVVYLEHNSPYQLDVTYGQVGPIIHVGLCVPASCNTQEVMRLVGAYLDSDLFLHTDLHYLKPHVRYAKPIEFKAEHYYKLISFQLLVSFGIYTLLLTLCAYRLRRREMELKSSNAAAVRTQAGKNLQSSTEKTAMSRNSLEEFILCYDIQLNWSRIFGAHASATNNAFDFLNGARVVSGLVSTYFHHFIFLNAIVSNVPQLFTYVSNIGNMDVAMDIFLLVSGFLQVYTFLKNQQRIESIRRYNFTQSTVEIMKTAFHRYLRLAPLYYMMLCASYLTLHYLDNTAIFHEHGVLAEKCELYWWRNVLFIHNLFAYKDICLIWTWYLACEIQYSIVLSLLLVTYVKHPKIAKISVLLIIIGSLAYQAVMGLHLNYQVSLEFTFTHFTELYMHPLARIVPYLAGAITSWLFLGYNSKLRSYKILNNFSSHLIFMVLLISMQAAPLGRAYTVRMSTLILILQRCCLSLTGCWSVLAMANQHLDVYRRIFGAKVFQKAIHAAYALSLLNCVLILGIFSYGSNVVFAEPIRMTVLYIGLVIVLYVLSFAMTLFFEMPYRNLSTLLMKRNAEKDS